MTRLAPTVSPSAVTPDNAESSAPAPVSGAAAMSAIVGLLAAFGSSTTKAIIGKPEQRADLTTFAASAINDSLLGPTTLGWAETVRAAYVDPRCSVPHKADPSRSAPARVVLGVALGFSSASVNPDGAAIAGSYTAKRSR